jgi:hypothetical protein
MGVEQRGRPGQRARGQPVVRGQQHRVVAVRPLQQTLVVGGDVPAVDRVHQDLDPRILRGELPGPVRGVVRGRVVDDQNPDVDAGLVVQRAADRLGEEMPIPVARDDHAD